MSAIRYIQPMYALKTSVFLLVVLVCSLAVTAPSFAESTKGQRPDRAFPYFKYSESDPEPIIEYTLVHDLLVEQDPEPLLRVYGNGRVHVHYPKYMKRAGDYKTTLTKPELKSLIRELAENGLVDFDRGKALGRKKQLEKRQRDQGRFHAISDSTITLIDIRLDEYQPKASGPVNVNVISRFSWSNLDQDEKHFPELIEIKGPAQGARVLRSLMNHPGLGKTRPKYP